jgi:peptidoglycan/LPS O-acetylase OafA/YrhL
MRALLDFGWFGVDIFFLLSGYGIAAKLSRPPAPAGLRAALNFAGDRAVRIYPLYWASMLVLLAMAFLASRVHAGNWLADLPLDPLGLFATVFLIEPLTGTNRYIAFTWTLNCELGFYLIVALALAVRRPLRDRGLMVGAAVLTAASLMGLIPVARWLFTFWPTFACGLFVHAALRQRAAGDRTGFFLATGAVAAIGLAALIGPLIYPRLAATAVVALGLIALHPYDGVLSSHRLMRPLFWCGTVSFPLVLLHGPIITRVDNLAERVIAPNSIWYPLVPLAAVGVSLLAAAGMHRWAEQPLQRWRTAKTQPRCSFWVLK